MNKLALLLSHETVRLIDHSKETTIFNRDNTPLSDFAVDDAIATAVGQHTVHPTVRFWVHPNVVVLGIIDGKLPHLEDGLQYLRENHFHAVIRNSGGLAVLLNRGVLNMSIIIPGNQEVSIHDGYEMMLELVQLLFSSYTDEIEAYEIVGSYCPGDYDLSIRGKKFAGISQRRVRNGIAVQIYIDIEGSSYERASIVRDFYRCSKKDTETKMDYPEVNPHVVSSINELLDQQFTVQEVIDDIRSILEEKGVQVEEGKLIEEEEMIFQKRYEQMLKRNETIRSYNP